MKAEILIYTRQGCCLCEEMKRVIRPIAERYSIAVKEIDIDSRPQLQERYTHEVPVLFINDRKAFKYRVTAKALEATLIRAQRQGKLGSFFRQR